MISGGECAVICTVDYVLRFTGGLFINLYMHSSYVSFPTNLVPFSRADPGRTQRKNLDCLDPVFTWNNVVCGKPRSVSVDL